jgi:hypothetical protein
VPGKEVGEIWRERLLMVVSVRSWSEVMDIVETNDVID